MKKYVTFDPERSAVTVKCKRMLLKRAQERKNLERWRSDPLAYMTERLGIRKESVDWGSVPGYEQHQWDGTVNPLKAVLDHLAAGRWVGVESATGTGKTFLGACIVFWFLECFERSLVVTTAPKEDQLTLHIWKEIGRMKEQFGKGHLSSLKLRMQEKRDDWLAVGFVAGVGADEVSATRAQGFHAKDMLIILEETPGISDAVINAFQNTSTATHNLILAFGNPDNQMDTLHRFCSMPIVEHIRISALDHPNVVLDDTDFIPGAASSAGIERMLTRYGSTEHPLYLSRVRGISPAESEETLIRSEWLRAVIGDKEVGIDEYTTPAIGVDVANSEAGDRAAIAFGRGGRLLYVRDFRCPDANQLGKRDVAALMRDEAVLPERTGVDATGVGAGTVNALRECGFQVQSLHGAASPVSSPAEERFINLRSQMWWQLREDIRNERVALPNDVELIADLTMPGWSVRGGLITIEAKDEIKKRLGRSPNKGDAVVYWNWVRQTRTRPRKLKPANRL